MKKINEKEKFQKISQYNYKDFPEKLCMSVTSAEITKMTSLLMYRRILFYTNFGLFGVTEPSYTMISSGF